MRGAVNANIAQALETHRPALKKLLAALRARRSSRQEELLAEADFGAILSAFPIWLVKLSDVHRVLPREPALFDLAIFDEATPCDPASALPVCFRSRRVAVTGGPKQLRHVSFLSRARQAALAERNGLTPAEAEPLDYRERSLLDGVEDRAQRADQVLFLDEHFRSRPPIIAFSNREIYHGALKIMTRHPVWAEEGAVEIVHVPGRRRPDGRNPEEVEAVLSRVRGIIDDSRSAGVPPPSLGVLSPFRDQVEALSEALGAALDARELERHQILVGTAYGFQGAERDVMLLSWAAGAGAHAATWRYLMRVDVFNVAITRARDRQIVVTSVTAEQLPEGSLLRDYLEGVAAGPRVTEARDPVEDRFLAELRAALEAEGCRAWSAWAIAGLTLDLLLIERDGRALGIDLIGYPGQLADAFELERYRMLQRAGVPVFPLTYSGWARDREGSVAAALTRIS